MPRQRYTVIYGEQKGSNRKYIVWDNDEKKIVAADDDKPTIIAKSQELNGFVPIDGSEQTYGTQIKGV